jgi:hypothetical protein
MRYPVDRTSDDGLETQIWQFESMIPYSSEPAKLVVAVYGIGTRKTRRHKWDWHYRYERGMRQRSNMKAEQVPLPDDVKAEALSLFMDSVVVEV